MSNFFIIPDSDARIKTNNFTNSTTGLDGYDTCQGDYAVVDKGEDVINGQEFTSAQLQIPTAETNKELYFARHLQTYVYDGLTWLPALTAQSE